MRVVLTNFGTRGDFQPLLALGAELVAKGHNAVYAVPPFAAALVREHGFEPEYLGPDLSCIRDQINSAWTTNDDLYDSADQLWMLLRSFQPYIPDFFKQLSGICKSADVLISGPAQPVARMVHEACGVPFVSVQFSHFGGNGGPALRRAGALLVNPFRVSLGLAPLNDPLTIDANSPQLALYAMSTHLRPRSSGWPAHHHLTGFFYGPRSVDPSASLADFVESGPAPVTITFGSMIHNADDFLPMIVRAVKHTGCRAVIQDITGAHLRNHDNYSIYWAESLPHEWLFPRSACIVFHGGSGTTAAVLKAGVPGIFVPHADSYDQRYWGQLCFELGCAGEPIELSGLTAPKLAGAIQEAVDSSSRRNVAARLGEKIRAERGVQVACSMIEILVRRIGLAEMSDF